MKKLLLAASFLFCGIGTQAYTTNIIQDSIATNTTWTCDQQYLLKGYVYVTAGHTLTINAGVIVRGDKDTKGALIVERGAQLRIMGTATSPVVFTSAQPAGSRSYGDWGGIILCGRGPVNWTAGEAQVEGGPRSRYGGTDANDNSGEIHYCRIEFGGVAFTPNNEVNGLTLCGVGAGTQLDHIMVSYCGDDGFEWFGGTVNAKYLVSYASWDDDFDVDNGYNGKNQFCAVIRDPYAADQSGSKAFETDSYLSGTVSGLAGDTTKVTKCIFSNVTAIGPLVNPAAGAIDPQYVAGLHIRRGSAISVLNSVIGGFPCGLLIDESSSSYGSTVANIGLGITQFRNNIIAGTATYSTPNPKDIMFVRDGARNLTPTTTYADTTSTGTDWTVLSGVVGPKTWVGTPSYKNFIYPTMQTGVKLINPFSATSPDLRPQSTSPICFNSTRPFNPNNPINYDTTGGYVNYNVPANPPEFATSKASDPFFTRVNYIGAFAGTGAASANWMAGWTNFDPLNEFYDTTCYVVNGIVNVAKPAFMTAKVFPNPASATATVSVDMKHSSTLKVTVADLTGKIVKEVYNGETSMGDNNFTFDISNLANGLYIINLVADNQQKSIKFTVAR